MAQLSRPYQLALVAVALLAAVWVLALRGHSASTSGSGSSPAPAPSKSVPKSTSPSSTTSHSPSAPGVEGLNRAIAKAHGAVATSQQNAKQLEEKSAQASSTAGTSASTTSTGSTPASGSATHSSSTTHSSSAPPTHAATKGSGSALPARQRAVEAELSKGDVVVLLFWDPKGADDQAVHREVHSLGGGKVAVHEAPASQVASFGSITRGVQVYGTPTLLIVGKHGQTRTLTGLQDAYSVRQAIDEARHF